LATPRFEPVIPFQGTVAEPESALAPASEGQSPKGETGELLLEDLGAAIPFETTNDDADSIDGTQEVSLEALGADPMPFDSTPGSVPSGFSANERPHQARGATSFHAPVLVEEPLPFQTQGAARDHRLEHRFQAAPISLAQLAAIFVEMRHQPRETVLARYGIDEVTYRKLDRERRDLPAQDGRFAGAWQKACDEYQRWRSGALGETSP